MLSAVLISKSPRISVLYTIAARVSILRIQTNNFKISFINKYYHVLFTGFEIHTNFTEIQNKTLLHGISMLKLFNMQEIDSIISCKEISKADIVLMTVGYDRTASHRKGAVEGGNAIIKCLHEDIEFFDRFSKTEPGYDFNFFHHDLGNLNHLFPEEMVEKVSDEYEKLENKFVFILGGEHSISTGAFKGLLSKHKPEEVTVLLIDAHPDLRNDDSNANPDQSRPSKYAHCSVLRRIHEMGYKEVQVGVRSYAREEYEYWEAHKETIKVYEWLPGEKPSIEQILSSIKTKKIYIEIDVDGIDPAFMPATGTPVQGGLDWDFTSTLIRQAIEKFELVGAGILEVAPRSDDVRTEYGAAQICYNICSQHLLKSK